MKRLWINTGEYSGDMQAAAVLRELRRQCPDLEAMGMGGDNLAKAGQRQQFDISELSVMGIAEILTVLPRAFRLLRAIKRTFKEQRPDAVLLVDAPEFNFRVAKIAHELGIPVYYFIPPKLWAWRTGRVRFLQRYVRQVFCILPFEPAFYARHGVDVAYVGNPLVDMVHWDTLRHTAPIAGRIGLMAGSRRKEVEALMPLYGQTAQALLVRYPHLTFHCLRAPTMREDDLRALWGVPVPLHFDEPETRYTAMRQCQCLIAASGTATLETALAGVPTVVTYRVSPFSAWIGRRLIRVPWVSLPNLIMERAVFPEHLQEDATPERLTATLTQWLDNPDHLDHIQHELEDLRLRCGTAGSAAHAASALLSALTADERTSRSPDASITDNIV